VKVRAHKDFVTVIGRAATITAGEWLTASGDRLIGSGAVTVQHARTRIIES
jgi:hypothetical protein